MRFLQWRNFNKLFVKVQMIYENLRQYGRYKTICKLIFDIC